MQTPEALPLRKIERTLTFSKIQLLDQYFSTGSKGAKLLSNVLLFRYRGLFQPLLELS